MSVIHYCISCNRRFRYVDRLLCNPCRVGLKKFTRRGLGLDTTFAPLPRPTHHLPGSAAKLRVFECRAINGESLFSPDDARATIAIERRDLVVDCAPNGPRRYPPTEDKPRERRLVVA